MRGKELKLFSPNYCDQFIMTLKYAKQTKGLFKRIIGKISSLTVLQYINKINNRPFGQIKYALL